MAKCADVRISGRFQSAHSMISGPEVEVDSTPPESLRTPRMQRLKQSKLFQNRSLPISVLILVVGVSIGIACYLIVVHFDNRDSVSFATNGAASTQDSLVSGFRSVTNLALVAKYLELHPDFSCDEYERFMSPLLDADGDIVYTTVYIKHVLHENRAETEANACNAIFDHFTEFSSEEGFVERANVTEYYPILNIFPTGESASAILYDFASTDLGLQFIDDVLSSDDPSATDRISLRSDNDVPAYGVYVMWPINGTRSFVAALFRFNEALNVILGTSLLEPFDELYIYDVNELDNPVFLYTMNGISDADYSEIASFKPVKEFDFLMADRTYRCFMTYHDSGVSVAAVLLLSLITLFTVMVSLFNLLLGQRFATIKALYNENKELEFQSDLKTQFLSSVSHEIRTPLCGIISMANFLDESIPDAQITDKEYIHNISTCGEMILKLINSVLDLHKVESGLMSLCAQDIDLAENVSAVVNMCRVLAIEKQVYISDEYDTSIPIHLLGDSLRIRQVFMNLLTNSVKFSPRGSEIKVKVNLKKKTKNHVTVGVEIADQGIGIAEDKIPGLFIPFVQAETDTYRKFGGTGLGLSIANAIVKLMGGHIEVASTLGKGSTFSFTMTLSITPALEVIAITTPLAYGGSRVLVNHNSMSISSVECTDSLLLVEDNVINTKIMSKYLTRWEIPFKHAENGLIAVNMCMEEKFSVILMDIQVYHILSIVSYVGFRCQ